MTRRIPIWRRGEIVTHSVVDDAHYEQFSQVRWGLTGLGYARSVDGYMARLVCGLEPGDKRAVHHINEDKLDNRRANLEVCEGRGDANRRPHPKRNTNSFSAHLRLIPFEELLAMAQPQDEEAAA